MGPQAFVDLENSLVNEEYAHDTIVDHQTSQCNMHHLTLNDIIMKLHINFSNIKLMETNENFWEFLTTSFS